MYTIGIDLGGTNIAVGLCDADLNIIDKLSTKTPKDSDVEVVKAMAETTKALMDRNSLTIADIEYLGMAVPGSIDPELGIVEYSNNIRFENFPIVKEFQKHPECFDTIVCVTGQHREMLDQVLDIFEVRPDYDLNIM